jgi:hypothetical protein
MTGDIPLMNRAAADLITVEDYRAMPEGPPYHQLIDGELLLSRSGVLEEWLIDPYLEQIHRYDFKADPAKPVRIVDSDESFETPLFPGLVVNAVDVFKH